MMMVYYYAVLSTSAAGAAAGCGCSGWEDHPNTLLGDDGSGVVKTGISFDDCREACCESAGCVAFGHCIQDADGSDNAACAYKGAGRCIWYQHNTKSLRRNPGHFTGFQHGDHCKPAPSGGGGGGGGAIVLPHFDPTGNVGWGGAVLLSVASIVSAYFGAGAIRGLSRGRGVLPHRNFWVSLWGLVRDGATFAAHATGLRDRHASFASGATAAARSATTGDMTHLLDRQVRRDQGTEGQHMTPSQTTASRGDPTRLHIAAQLADVVQMRKLLAVDGGHSIDINAGDHRRYTAFHVACAGGHAQCAQLLVDEGCDTKLHNGAGLTAWALARELKRASILSLHQQQLAAHSQAPPVSVARVQSRKLAADFGAPGTGGRDAGKAGSRSRKPNKSSGTKAGPGGAGGKEKTPARMVL